MNKVFSIITIIIAALGLIAFGILYFSGSFEYRWIITAIFCVFLIVINVIDIRNGGNNG